MKQTIFACLIVISAFSCDQERKVDLLESTGIFITDKAGTTVLNIADYDGLPDEEGILKTWDLNIPPFVRGIYFSADGISPYGFISHNRSHMWILDENFTIINPPVNPDRRWFLIQGTSQEANFALFELKSGKYLAISSVLGEKTIGYMTFPGGSLPKVSIASFGTDHVEADVPVLAYSVSDNLYEAAYQVYSAITDGKLKGINALMREKKHYHEYFKYLGWCSWEEYKLNVPADTIMSVMERIHASNIPVRWVLIDAGTQWLAAEERRREPLYSFEPYPGFYPDGFKPLMDHKKEDGIRWMGIWHHQCGYFGGIAKDNIMGEEFNKHFKTVPGGELMPKGNRENLKAFFNGLFQNTIEAGFDFIKVDFQASLFEKYLGTANGVYAKSTANQVMEKVCVENELGLLNCIASGIASLFNTSHSVVTRVSQDYMKEHPEAGPLHIFQGYNNLVWMGHIVFGDHDMFHSSDTVTDRIMSLSKAMSAAPIYLSDTPEDFVEEHIMPLCYQDGELLRPLAPALPLPESFFSNALNEPNMYVVIAPLHHGAAALVAYNLLYGKGSQTVPGKVSKNDYKHASALLQPYPGEWEIPGEGLILYDWELQMVHDINTKDYTFELPVFSDKLVHLCPIKDGWSLIGRIDKFLSPAAIMEPVFSGKQMSFKVKEAGQVAFYMDSGAPDAGTLALEERGKGLWMVMVPEEVVGKEIVIIRK